MIGEKKYHTINSQCFRREDEINYIKSIFEEENYGKADSIRQADVIIYFTCGLGEKNVAEELINIEDIQHIKKKSAELVVAGCLPILHRDRLDAIFNGTAVTPVNYLPLNNILNKEIDFNINSFSRNHKYKELMKICIAKGCIRRCAYCKTRLSIGKLRSKAIDNIIEELRMGLAGNIRTFTVFADNIGDYGVDIGTNIGQLIDAVNKISGDFQLDITDFHPAAFIKYFEHIRSLAVPGRLTKIHIPVQTGNQRVLHLMNRYYDLNELRIKLKELKAIYPVRYVFDFIIGFPTETEEEFQDTLDFIKEFSEEEFVLATYHDMPSTDSYDMDGKVPEETKKKRYERIRALNVKIYFELVG